MWERIVECVPNISEGGDHATIAAAAAAVRSVAEVCLLDVDPDPAHNRTVLTMVGTPDGVERAVLALYEAVLPRIDLRKHKGEHPRMGAVDVVPVIPIRGVRMEECVALSHRLGNEIWSRYEVPIYFYEESASTPERRDLARIRKGEFEGFPEKLRDPRWQPDVGEAAVHPSAGVTAVGAREFLIAFNVNLATDDLRVAKEIAKAVRGSSGGFRYVKALGLELSDRRMVQVSMNLTNFKKTPISRVVECIRSEAARHGVNVAETEIVGLVPQGALDEVALYYLGLASFSPDMVVERRVQRALAEESGA